MNRFLDLWNREIKKVNKFILLLTSLYLIIQTFFVYRNTKNIYNTALVNSKVNNTSIVNELIRGGRANLASIVNGSRIYLLGIFLLLMIGFIYAMVIWYREWFGNNKTIYTLLALPVKRMTIYTSKLATIIYIFGCFVASFMAALFININLVKSILTSQLVTPEKIYQLLHSQIMIYLLDMRDLFAIIAVVIGLISLIFLFVLLERSYKIKGVSIGAILIIGYLIGIGYLYSTPSLFSIEKLICQIVIGITITVICALVSEKLLKEKVSV